MPDTMNGRVNGERSVGVGFRPLGFSRGGLAATRKYTITQLSHTHTRSHMHRNAHAHTDTVSLAHTDTHTHKQIVSLSLTQSDFPCLRDSCSD